MLRLLTIPARDRDATDKITLTIHGPKTADRTRLIGVLAHLLASDAEWDSPRPNVDFIVSMDEPEKLSPDARDFVDAMAGLNPTLGQYVRECLEKGGDIQTFEAAFETAAKTVRGWCIGRFGA